MKFKSAILCILLCTPAIAQNNQCTQKQSQNFINSATDDYKEWYVNHHANYTQCNPVTIDTPDGPCLTHLEFLAIDHPREQKPEFKVRECKTDIYSSDYFKKNFPNEDNWLEPQ